MTLFLSAQTARWLKAREQYTKARKSHRMGRGLAIAFVLLASNAALAEDGGIASTGTFTAYPRYSGMMQTQPLTADEKKYDDILREIDSVVTRIGDEPLSRFSAVEFMTFTQMVERGSRSAFFGPDSLDRADKRLAEFKELLSKLETR